MQPIIHLNWLAILVAVVASFIVGGLWYGPLFGKPWKKEMGVPDDAKPSGAEMGKALGLNVLGTLLTAYVLAHEVQGWRPSSWNAGPDAPAATYGFFAAFFAWLGFVVPVLLNGVAFERKSWKLFGINASFQLVSLVIIGMILTYWR
ncbi:MAG: DUF1761 domain-containing protein [Acidobacteriota bacterium]|nr:DUF1761 domain-containing protein [Acidobacteriota bacterium]